MTPTTKAELLPALADDEREIRERVERIVGPIGHKEWREELDRVVELREARDEFEKKMADLKE